ncbi:Transposase_IS4 [Hexamita inflata]|uniref:Transposase IS4 n=1 Tax=Hexamita inflata TaxID=28002 RepID=A0AA86TK64_9EUKA|nr:Transposase IS4 [Hexamita inflata]
MMVILAQVEQILIIYLMILFTMMISGKGRGSAKDNWSKDPIIRNQFIADEIGMTYDEWEEIHSSVCYGHISGSLDTPEPDIDTNIDGVESDQEESELDYDEDQIDQLNLEFNQQDEIILSKNKTKETKVRNSVSRVQDFMKMLQNRFREIYAQYPNYFIGKNIVIDEQLIKFAGRIFFLQYNPAKPAKRGILVRTCVDTFTNFIISRQYPDFPKQPNCTLFCDNYYSTIEVVEYIKSLGYEYVGTFRPSRLGKEQSQKLQKLNINEVAEYEVTKQIKIGKKKTTVIVQDVYVLQWQCKKNKTLTMIYNKSKYVDEPQKMQAFTSAREIPREQPEIVRHFYLFGVKWCARYHFLPHYQMHKYHIRMFKIMSKWMSIFQKKTLTINIKQLFYFILWYAMQTYIRNINNNITYVCSGFISFLL